MDSLLRQSRPLLFCCMAAGYYGLPHAFVGVAHTLADITPSAAHDELCINLPSGIYLSALFSSFQACILAQGIVPAAGCCVGVGSRHVGTVFFCSFWFHHIYTIIMTEYGTSLSRCMSLRRVFFITYLMCALRRVSLGTGHIPVYLHKQYLFCGCNRAVAQSSGLQQDVRWGSAAQFFHPFHRRKIPRH